MTLIAAQCNELIKIHFTPPPSANGINSPSSLKLTHSLSYLKFKIDNHL